MSWLRKLLEVLPAIFRLVVSVGPWFYRDSNRSLRAAMRQHDIVIFQGYQSNSLRLRYALRLDKTIVYMPHSPSIQADELKMLRNHSGRALPRSKYQDVWRTERNLIRSAHVVVFPTRNSQASYEAHFRRELEQVRIAYINSGIALELGAYQHLSVTDKPARVLFVGRYVEHKGYDLFVEAAEFVAGRNRSVEFMTVGDGPLKRTSGSVFDVGWTETPESFIRSASLIVVPNRIAYFDLLPLEAAALGKPMVMTKVGGNIDQLRLLPDTIACSTADLAAAIENALERLQVDPKWGEKNRHAFEMHFTAKKMAEQWLLLLESFN